MSLNIQGEEFVIFDEVVYFKTIRRAAATSASNDKTRHSLLNMRMCCSQEVGKTSEDTDKKRFFLSLSSSGISGDIVWNWQVRSVRALLMRPTAVTAPAVFCLLIWGRGLRGSVVLHRWNLKGRDSLWHLYISFRLVSYFAIWGQITVYDSNGGIMKRTMGRSGVTSNRELKLIQVEGLQIAESVTWKSGDSDAFE